MIIFEKLLISPKWTILSALCDSIGASEFDDVTKALIPLVESTGTSLSLLRHMIAKEISETGTKYEIVLEIQ
jgi:hypothetical protein